MPAGYEKIRDKLAKRMSLKAAKKHAAMIWNSKHKGAEAVGRYSEDTSGLVGAGGNEGNEQGVAGAATSSKSLKSPKIPEKTIKKPEEIIKPVDTTMKENFFTFMEKFLDEDRAERLYQDSKHSGKLERGKGAGSPQRRMAPLHIKHYGEWPDEVAKDNKDKAMKHGYRQSVKRDIAKAVEESFKAAQSKIASKEGVSKERAGAILAASSRNASAKAKKKNPKLRKVKG